MIRKGRKHKRGDRGSLKEEPRDSKRANMAAAEGGNEGTPTEKPLEATEEPSLSELREMLIDIQIDLHFSYRNAAKIDQVTSYLKT